MSGLQFTPAHVRLIQRGVKTQTRRRVKGDDPPRWRKGRSYAVQPGRGRPALCRVKILDAIRCDTCKGAGGNCTRCAIVKDGVSRSTGELAGVRMELLGDLTYEDAVREGYRTRDEYKGAWLAVNDRAWVESMVDLLGALDAPTCQIVDDPALAHLDWTERTLVRRLRWLERAGAVNRESVDCPECGPSGGDADCPTCEGATHIEVWERQEQAEITAALARWEQRWANTPVWVITFTLDTAHQPRYLAAESVELYVSSPSRALDHEAGEAVTEAEQATITKNAGTEFSEFQKRERETRDAERARYAFEHRLRTCRNRAALYGIDITQKVWQIEKLIAERRSPAAILKTLQSTERLLDERKAAA